MVHKLNRHTFTAAATLVLILLTNWHFQELVVPFVQQHPGLVLGLSCGDDGLNFIDQVQIFGHLLKTGQNIINERDFFKAF